MSLLQTSLKIKFKRQKMKSSGLREVKHNKNKDNDVSSGKEQCEAEKTNEDGFKLEGFKCVSALV